MDLDIIKGGLHPGVAHPGVLVGAALAGPHVPHTSLVPHVAHAVALALGRPLRVVALEGLVALGLLHVHGVAHPLDCLPVGHQPHVLHVGDGVQEGDEALLVVRRGEPRSVVEQSHGSPVGGVVALEVLDEHLVDPLGVRRRGAGVAHGAAAAVQVLPHHHRHLPQSREGISGAGWDHAVVEQLVVEGVGVAGWSVLVDWHGRVIREILLVQHLEHVVASHRQEGRAHAADVVHAHAAIRRHDLPLPCDLAGPLALRELLPEAVRDGVRSDFMALCIQVLNLRVVRPFVGDVECGGDRATVGVGSTSLEEFHVQFFIEIID